jgi:tight adherence protein B
MIILALPLLAGALLTWPVRAATARLRALRPPGRTDGRRSRRHHRRLGLIVLVAIGVAVLLLGGPALALATVVATATLRSRWRARHQLRNRLDSGSAVAEALRGLVAELRAGAHPAAAADQAMTDAQGPAIAVLGDIAITARLGGDVHAALLRRAAESPMLAPVLRPVAYAWALAHRHGLPLAEVLDAVRRDLEGRLRFARQVHARMAGPRASGTVLLGLPVVAVLFGLDMGANPVRVLLLTGTGHTLLAIGTTLACAGTLWIAKLTGKAVLP